MLMVGWNHGTVGTPVIVSSKSRSGFELGAFQTRKVVVGKTSSSWPSACRGPARTRPRARAEIRTSKRMKAAEGDEKPFAAWDVACFEEQLARTRCGVDLGLTLAGN